MGTKPDGADVNIGFDVGVGAGGAAAGGGAVRRQVMPDGALVGGAGEGDGRDADHHGTCPVNPQKIRAGYIAAAAIAAAQ